MQLSRFLLLVTSSIIAGSAWAKEDKRDAKELYCLAQNIYFEARGEPQNGQFAVAAVTMNRVASPKFPNSICKVVWQRYQFSWTHDGKSDRPRDRKAWSQAKSIADLVYKKYFAIQEKTQGAWDLTRGALHYYSPSMANPYWAKEAQLSAVIGNHVFVSIN